METLKIALPERDSAITGLAFKLSRRQEVTLGKDKLASEELQCGPPDFGYSWICHSATVPA
jgi:hypothetical protein